MTPAEARARVARGAKHLDATVPRWFDRIDVGTLTLWDPCGCIVGQLTGSSEFHQALGVLGVDIDRDGEVSMGFDCSLPSDAASLEDYTVRRRAAFQPLQDAWLEAIVERRMPAVTVSSVLEGVGLAGALYVFLVAVSVL